MILSNRNSNLTDKQFKVNKAIKTNIVFKKKPQQVNEFKKMISVKDYEIVKYVFKEFKNKKDQKSVNSSEKKLLNT